MGTVRATRPFLGSLTQKRRGALFHLSAHRSFAAPLLMTNWKNPQNPNLGKSQWQCCRWHHENNFLKLKQILSNLPFQSLPPQSRSSDLSPSLSNPWSVWLLLRKPKRQRSTRIDIEIDRVQKAYSYDNYWRTVLSKDSLLSLSWEGYVRILCIYLYLNIIHRSMSWDGQRTETERKHGSTGEMTRPVMHDFNDDGLLYILL